MSKMRIAVVGAAVPALVAFGAGVASAATVGQASSPHNVVRMGMTQVGFNPDIAREHGFLVHTDVTGQQCAYRPGEVEVKTCTELPGDCGSSYVGIESRGFPGALDVRTGFEVDGIVAGGAWGTTLVDQGGESEVNFDIATGQNHWDGQREVTGLTPGPAFISVDTPYSQALLTDGRVCFSAGPQADAVVA